MWQEDGRIIQISTLCSLRSVSEHFGVYVFYGIECSEPEPLYIGQSAKFLINRLPQHLRYPTQGDKTGTFYKKYRDFWQERHIVTDARPYWKEYWNLLCSSELMVMAWPMGCGADEATDAQKQAIKALESKLIQSFNPKYNSQQNPGDNLEEWCMQDKFDELSCELRRRREAMRESGSAQGRAGGSTGSRT